MEFPTAQELQFPTAHSHPEWLHVPEPVPPACYATGTTYRRKKGFCYIGVWSFNAERCRGAGQLEELLHTASQQDLSTSPALKGLNWISVVAGKWGVALLVLGEVRHSNLRQLRNATSSQSFTQMCQSDSVLRTRLCPRPQRQNWSGCAQLDLYVPNSYSLRNSQGATSEAKEEHERSRAALAENTLVPREMVWSGSDSCANSCIGGISVRGGNHSPWRTCSGGTHVCDSACDG